jgi:hypothetical protein
VTGRPAGVTLAEQACQVFANLATVPRAGVSRADLPVSTTVAVADADLAELFSTNAPARVTMQAALPLGLLISIGCTTVLAESGRSS